MPIAAISVVHEIAALYLINTADGVLTSSDVNMYYGGAAFGLVLSAAKAAMMMGGSADDEEVAARGHRATSFFHDVGRHGR